MGRGGTVLANLRCILVLKEDGTALPSLVDDLMSGKAARRSVHKSLILVGVLASAISAILRN
jgi:hypothetical protein